MPTLNNLIPRVVPRPYQVRHGRTVSDLCPGPAVIDADEVIASVIGECFSELPRTA